ncbi:hypothetical protein ACFV9P_17945 [Streptomyces sp. NPDC059892]
MPGKPEATTATVPVRTAVCLTMLLLPPEEKVRNWLHCSSPNWAACAF